MRGLNRKISFAGHVPVFVLLFFSAILSGCKQWIDERADTMVMENMLGRVADALEDGDLDALKSLILRDRSLIVVGPGRDEVYYGWDEVETKVKSFLEEIKQLQIDVTERQISPGIDERTAYFLQTADVQGAYNDRSFSLEGLRITGVMERHAGRWLIVQAHLSAAVSDDQDYDKNAEER